MLTRALLGLSIVLCNAGKYAESQQVAEACLTLANELEVHICSCQGNSATAETYLHLGQYDRERKRARTFLELAREIDHQWCTGSALHYLGAVAVVRSDYMEAFRWLQESLAVFEGMHHQYQYLILVYLALVKRAEGRKEEAAQALREALCSLVTSPHREILLVALPAVALLTLDAGDVKRAVELYARAAREPRVANSQWFKDMAGREIAAAAATLPPDVVVAAQERGRARDLMTIAEELLAELDKIEDVSH
jgi:tetratricopeptide (TPR) repeat protein